MLVASEASNHPTRVPLCLGPCSFALIVLFVGGSDRDEYGCTFSGSGITNKSRSRSVGNMMGVSAVELVMAFKGNFAVHRYGRLGIYFASNFPANRASELLFRGRREIPFREGSGEFSSANSVMSNSVASGLSSLSMSGVGVKCG